ncbi:amino acid deaminase/aldolase [Cohnella lupini]|uniref:D-serine deaminase-like pyridoxal phosphate-dependent protein n=1 Tax=Cohnella lupini TaxID=1294267 RepID=A0A3D9I577_9BACL|nr:amino acid deaminase/aldolase [Cohnella lupini]RED56831.1 D-serine deaminase-like pyridoxal phosphate-dependent protein [Cohnella lupini]
MPFAYVDIDLLDRNIREIARAAGNKKIRVASKSIRSVEVLRRIMRSDDTFQGIMCYTATEAAFLAKQGLQDLLLGYPVWEPGGIRLLADLIGEGHGITFMADCLEHVDHLEKIAQERGVRLPLCLDIDMSANYPGLRFGVWRSPLRDWDHVRPVVEKIMNSKWVWLDGIMGYEAQIAGVGDLVPGAALKNNVVRYLKSRSIREVALRRQRIVQRIQELGLTLRFVNAGGTGSLSSSRQEEWVTELTAGSGFYSPTLFDHYRSFRFEPAAGFAVEVVRQPRKDIVTCLGGGYTASGAADRIKLPKPYLPAGLELFPMEGAGEVQTPLLNRGKSPIGLGDPVFFRHAKAGELCERFDTLHVVSNGVIVGGYSTYRGMGETFL